jgi:hypothetical protein
MRRRGEVVEDVIDRDRLRLRLEPARGDHRRKALDEVLERAVGLAARADDHAGAEVRERWPLVPQRQRGSVAAAQVLRAWLVPEPAEVHDAPDSLALCHLRERGRGAALALLEVPARSPPHPVDQVVGDVDAGTGAAQGVGAGDVALVELAAALGELPRALTIAHQATHLEAVRGQPACKPPSDEPGRACDERFQSVRTAA